MSALVGSPSHDKKMLFSDQATHISAALSIWHDRDLRYTVNDLDRFRQELPAETGPRGIFLKVANNEVLYYAKPFLYALFSAPFVGINGLNGFAVFNLICYFVIGAVFLRIMLPVFGSFYSGVMVISIIVLSPFTAWISIAHPDLFIAALLSVGGFFLINQRSSMPIRILGAFIIGMALYEKMTFVFAMPFLLIPLMRSLRIKDLFFVLAVMLLGWLIPTSINLWQDGNVLAYQGIRFYAGGIPFPLENGWRLPQTGITEHIFKLEALISALFGNIYVLPEKFIDFIVGRQTGILLYFPAALALLIISILNPNQKSVFIIAGLFSYLVIHWLVFPTNGYGGAGTYGSRYLMQALPLIILAFLWQEERNIKTNGQIKMWVKCLVLIAAGLSLVFQYQVLPPSEKLVRNPPLFFKTQRAQIFPFESSLLPTIEHIMPKAFKNFVSDGKTRHIIYKTGFKHQNNYALKVDKFSKSTDFVLYQIGPEKAPPPLGVVTSKNMILKLVDNGIILKELNVPAGIHEFAELDNSIFKRSFYGLELGKEIRWRKLELQYSPVIGKKNNSAGWLDVVFDYRLSTFQRYGKKIIPDEFCDAAVRPDFHWSHKENWGVWTDGEYASLTLNLGEEKRKLLFKFNVHAYVPPESPERTVNVFVNGRRIDTWTFVKNDAPPETKFIVTPDDMSGSSFAHIGFNIGNPKSPLELGRGGDPRKLGLGLSGLEVIKIE